MNRWLTKNQYSRIRYKAKKMGAEDINLCAIWHSVWFNHTIVRFVFKPLQFNVSFYSRKPLAAGYFSNVAEADEIKKDMDTALEFIEYLKNFETKINKEESKCSKT